MVIANKADAMVVIGERTRERDKARTEKAQLRNALRDILCITKENYHTGCTCFSCTAYEIARKALEGKCSP